MYKNYIFDLYGTLVDIHTNETKYSLWEKLVEFYAFNGANYTRRELKQTYEEKCKQLLAEIQEYRYPEIRIEQVFGYLYAKKQVLASEELIIHTAQLFRILSTKYIRLYDDVIETLTTLRNKGKQIYLLSNAQRVFTEYEMKYLGIEQFFDGIMLSSDEGCQKPDPIFYERLLERYGLDKKESVMIGNDSISDIKGAYQVGLDAVYIHSNLSPTIKEPLHCVATISSNLEELLLL